MEITELEKIRQNVEFVDSQSPDLNACGAIKVIANGVSSIATKEGLGFELMNKFREDEDHGWTFIPVVGLSDVGKSFLINVLNALMQKPQNLQWVYN